MSAIQRNRTEVDHIAGSHRHVPDWVSTNSPRTDPLSYACSTQPVPPVSPELSYFEESFSSASNSHHGQTPQTTCWLSRESSLAFQCPSIGGATQGYLDLPINASHSDVPFFDPFSELDDLTHPTSMPEATLGDSIDSNELSHSRSFRRKLQNRNAQRAYRARKEAQVRVAEHQMYILKQKLEESQRANKELMTRELELRKRLKELQEVLDAWELLESTGFIAHSVEYSSPANTN